jgi:UDP-N-acetylglucosamine--N-acetylmuramyl-(pentapeptide) pyrophosphoryl-undecaprenol N-acetylglucosamine transferase
MLRRNPEALNPIPGPLAIAVACGGTGGHIFPGLATAVALRRRGHGVTLWLAGKDIEGLATRGWDGPAVTIPAQGLPSRFSAGMLGAAWRLLRAAAGCVRRMRAEPPQVLLAMGSYASVGPVLAARRLGVPVVLHEANAVPGRACRFLAPFASSVAVAFEEAGPRLRARCIQAVGMPIREALERTPPKPKESRFPGAFTVLVAGGSRGAHALNELACAALAQLRAGGRAIAVIHLAGEADAASLRERYAHAGVPHEVHAFLPDMERAYRAADLAVCRSGASTCAELACFGLPSLLVPYPHAIHGHQSANARVLAARGAADVIEERDLTSAKLADYLAASAADPARRERMGRAASAAMPGRAAERLAELVEAVGGAHG